MLSDLYSGCTRWGFTVIYFQFLIWMRPRNSGRNGIEKYLSPSGVIIIYWVKAFVLKDNTEMASDANRSWQVNYNRLRRGASCHPLARDTWHIFCVLQDTCFGTTVSRCLKILGYYVEIWCVPSATYVLCINRSHGIFLPIRVVYYILRLFCIWLYMYSTLKCSRRIRNLFTMHASSLKMKMCPKEWEG